MGEAIAAHVALQLRQTKGQAVIPIRLVLFHEITTDAVQLAIQQAGAIDDKRSANPADAKSANNYVRSALNESLAGKPVTVVSTQPYGCSVKY